MPAFIPLNPLTLILLTDHSVKKPTTLINIHHYIPQNTVKSNRFKQFTKTRSKQGGELCRLKEAERKRV